MSPFLDFLYMKSAGTDDFFIRFRNTGHQPAGTIGSTCLFLLFREFPDNFPDMFPVRKISKA